MKLWPFIFLQGIMFCPPLFAYDNNPGKINITGTIHNDTCVLDNNDLHVDLGNINSREFTQSGSQSMAVHFAIALKQCDTTIDRVTVKFSGTAAHNSDLAAIDSSLAGAATGLGVNIMDSQKNTIPLNRGTRQFSLVPGSTDMTLDFYANYMTFSNTVTAGPASANVTFSLTYQ